MLRAVCVFIAIAIVSFLSGCPSLESFYRGRDDVGAQIDIAYTGDGLQKHRLDVYHPRDTKTAWPVVVFVHGGYWRGGDKTYWQAITGLYGNVGVALGQLGVGGVITNYRLYPDAKLDDMLDDVVGALKWTHDHVAEMGGDPNRIYLAGHSAGGHLVTLLGSDPERLRKRGFDPKWLKGVVAISGIYDIPANIQMVEPDIRDGVMIPLFGKDEAEELAASPMVHFDRNMKPTLFMAGELDYKGVKHDFDQAAMKLKPLVGDKAWFREVPGNTHEEMVLEMGTAEDEVGPAIAAFVRMIDSMS